MEVAGGDERTRIVLQRKLPGRNCLHCKGEGHQHTSCPLRPCYICGASGHLVLDCPHRRRPTLGLHTQRGGSGAHAALRAHLRDAELGLRAGPPPPLPSPQLGARVRARFERAHERRVTALEWHPRGRLVASGDKRGVIAITDIGARAAAGNFELSLASAKVHYANIMAFAFEGEDVLWSGAMDGCVKRSQIEAAFHGGGGPEAARPPDRIDTVVNFNPDGWTEGMTMSRWRSVTAVALDGRSRNCVYAATCKGAIYAVDARVGGAVAEFEKMHGDKIQFLEVNPVRPELLLSAGNDRIMALWDVRKLAAGKEVGFYRHPKVVFGATFSSNSGAKIVSTCHDNRVRVWNDVNALAGNGNERSDAAPTEIVHSHNFNRYLSPFRAHWDPKDWTDDMFLVGRFLGDAYSMKKGYSEIENILHPIDIFSAKSGAVISSIIDMNVTTKCPLNKFCPTQDIIVSGTSLHLAFWAVENKNRKDAGGEKDGDLQLKPRPNQNDSDDDDEDGGGASKKKKKKLVVLKRRNSTSVSHGRNTRSKTAAAAAERL